MAGMSTSLVISAARVAISALVVSATAIDEERTTCAATMIYTQAGYWKLSEPREQEQGKRRTIKPGPQVRKDRGEKKQFQCESGRAMEQAV
jgi:hypothetical protein